MKRTIVKILLIAPLMLIFSTAIAQREGIGFNLTPNGQYQIWDKKSGLASGLMYGGKLGFSFGKHLEISGTYALANNLKTDFSKYGFANYADSLYTSRSVDFRRIGGQVKMNIGSRSTKPYIIIGSGIQDLHLKDSAKSQQIFLDFGLGLNIKTYNKFSFALEAKTTRFNYNSVSSLMDASDRSKLGINAANYKAEELKNWSIGANMTYYIGRKSDTLTAFDKEYMQAMKGGFKGIRGTLEPVVGKIDFGKNLGYKNSRLIGLSGGVDFGQYVGLRAFYWRGLDADNKYTKLEMYGGELRAKFGDSRRITPYFILGAGEISTKNNYVARDSMSVASKKVFAQSGVGVSMNISKTVNLFGSARYILTTGANPAEVGSPEQLSKSTMYSAGFRFNIGRKARISSPIDYDFVDPSISTKNTESLLERNEVNNEVTNVNIDNVQHGTTSSANATITINVSDVGALLSTLKQTFASNTMDTSRAFNSQEVTSLKTRLAQSQEKLSEQRIKNDSLLLKLDKSRADSIVAAAQISKLEKELMQMKLAESARKEKQLIKMDESASQPETKKRKRFYSNWFKSKN